MKVEEIERGTRSSLFIVEVIEVWNCECLSYGTKNFIIQGYKYETRNFKLPVCRFERSFSLLLELFFHSDLKPLISTSNQHKTSDFKPVFKWFLLAFYIDTHRKLAQKYWNGVRTLKVEDRIFTTQVYLSWPHYKSGRIHVLI